MYEDIKRFFIVLLGFAVLGFILSLSRCDGERMTERSPVPSVELALLLRIQKETIGESCAGDARMILRGRTNTPPRTPQLGHSVSE